MILFDKDIISNNAIIDYETKNQSFLRMSVMLKRMGIKNNKFFLALTQKELIGVDPYDLVNLTEDLKYRIAYECKVNPWYYFREIVRVPAQGSETIMYELNRANLAFMWTYFNCIDVFLTIPRQIGKTISVMGLDSWLMYIVGININVGLFAKGNKLVLENVSRLKTIRDSLPPYLIYKQVKDTNNKEGLSYEALGNSYKTFTSQSDKKAAADQGRGESFIKEHWDEMAYYTNNDLSYPSAISATNTAAEQARKAGIPACNVITTTAGMIDSPAGEFAYGIKNDALRFTEKLYDCPDIETLKQVVEDNCNGMMIYIEFSHLQLGKDEEWFKTYTRNKPQNVILTDYLNQWLHGTDNTAVPLRLIDKIVEGEREPDSVTFFKSLMLRWYADPKVLETPGIIDKPYIIGMDTSDNIGSDYTTIVMIDPEDMRVVCTCRCNQSNLTYIAKCVVELLKKFGNSIFIPERNKNGALLIDIILDAMEGEDFNPYRRIFNTVFQNADANIDVYNLDWHGVNRKNFGFTTTKSETSRTLLYKNVLMSTLEMNHSRIFDSDLISEIKGLTVRKGRIDHPNGGTDDLVIAYLLTCYFVLYGKNLHLYGLKDSDLLSHVNSAGEQIDPVEKERQIQYRRQIQGMEKLISSTSSSVMRQTYGRELQRLKKLLDEDKYGDVISVDQLQDQVEQNKKQKKANNSESVINFFSKIYGDSKVA